jgi:hypothetical protein
MVPNPVLGVASQKDPNLVAGLVIDSNIEAASPFLGSSVGGVSSSPPTPPLLPALDASSSTPWLGLRSTSPRRSSPPQTPPVVLVAATGATPTRCSGRFGTAGDGASVTDEDSMLRAMRGRAELNLDYSGIVSPSKAKSFLSFSMLDINSKLEM